ncbi:MAG: hypothetical protein J1F29_00720 [Lentimicrobiaceae bacterium]|nr:hypothetical protein [Lentimicrobiaceae bacterium]
MLEGDALLRADFGIDPSILSDEEWVIRLQQALWLEYYRVNLIGRIFTPKKK